MSEPKPLSAVSTYALIGELFRRQMGRGDFSGDVQPCLILAVTPQDLAEYWESEESGATHPGSRIPEPEEWPLIVRAFEEWQDNGITSDLYQTLRQAWQAQQAAKLDAEGETK